MVMSPAVCHIHKRLQSTCCSPSPRWWQTTHQWQQQVQEQISRKPKASKPQIHHRTENKGAEGIYPSLGSKEPLHTNACRTVGCTHAQATWKAIITTPFSKSIQNKEHSFLTSNSPFSANLGCKGRNKPNTSQHSKYCTMQQKFLQLSTWQIPDSYLYQQ